MKKLFLTMCLTALLSGTAFAACDGGTWSDDGKFCISNIFINWWSAANWCKANGMHLATMYEACPDWDGNEGTRICPVLSSSIQDYGLTSTASGSQEVYAVYLSSGNVSTLSRHNTNYRALCTN